MKLTAKRAGGIFTILFFSLIFVVSFVVYPEVGEKILYGKHPPGKKVEFLEYSQIISSGDYDCMESSSAKTNGDFPKFVKTFNECHR